MSRGEGDHCNPAVAIDSLGVLYAVWQENARGVWQVCLSVSGDGLQWSRPTPIASTGNQVNPTIAAGMGPSGLVAVAWQSDAMGNQDIYVASSTDAFATAALVQVTVDPADQVEPAVAIDTEDSVVVLWTDARNASSDLYGAASSGGWANVPVVNIDSNQSQPAIAVRPAGRVLDIAWVDDIGGDADIFYASSEGLPASPLVGVDLVDDASRAEQRSPAVAVAVAEDGTERVLVCWVDGRNGNTDLCLADASVDSPGASVRVGNTGVASNRDEVALATDPIGRPHMVWTDDADGVRQVYWTSAEAVEPESSEEEQGELPDELS